MERNSERSTGLEWENLALYGGKPIENPQQLGFSMYSSSSSGFYFNNNNDGGSYSSIFSAKNANASSAEPMTIGLRLGEERENRDSFYSSKTSIPIATTAMRVSRLSMQNPCCQVEGCHVDLTSAKDYHRRHRICESHSKSPKVVVAGMERRFCQQCSRFHDLAEFDDKKRSCRRRLSVHNARRRRLQPESAHLSSGLSSALYDRRPPNLLLNGISVSVANPTWDNAGSSTMRQIGDTLNRPSNPVGIGRTNTLHFSNNEIPNSISSIQTSNPQGLSVPATISPTVPDLPSAHSLLSPTPWSIHEAESRSMENLLVHGNYNSVSREHYQSGYMQAKQPEHSLNIHTAAAGPSQMQEFQLFKASYESDCFYSSQRNL